MMAIDLTAIIDRWFPQQQDWRYHDVATLVREVEHLRNDIDTLTTYITYTACPECGLTNPMRPAMDCSQCRVARQVLESCGITTTTTHAT
jgi:hypothetical protein